MPSGRRCMEDVHALLLDEPPCLRGARSGVASEQPNTISTGCPLTSQVIPSLGFPARWPSPRARCAARTRLRAWPRRHPRAVPRTWNGACLIGSPPSAVVSAGAPVAAGAPVSAEASVSASAVSAGAVSSGAASSSSPPPQPAAIATSASATTDRSSRRPLPDVCFPIRFPALQSLRPREPDWPLGRTESRRG